MAFSVAKNEEVNAAKPFASKVGTGTTRTPLYTKGLFACIPNLMEEETALIPIEGMTPDPTNLPSGCRFHPRCPYAVDECSKTNPDSKEIEKGHYVKCLIKEE